MKQCEAIEIMLYVTNWGRFEKMFDKQAIKKIVDIYNRCPVNGTDHYEDNDEMVKKLAPIETFEREILFTIFKIDGTLFSPKAGLRNLIISLYRTLQFVNNQPQEVKV